MHRIGIIQRIVRRDIESSTGDYISIGGAGWGSSGWMRSAARVYGDGRNNIFAQERKGNERAAQISRLKLTVTEIE